MTDLPFIPTTPIEFDRLMTKFVWQDHCEPAPGGGITCYVSIWYDEWHDARITAEKCGMIRTGGSRIDGQNVDVYKFRDNPDLGTVRIWNKGSAIAANQGRRMR
jgi:hypothetical protein